MSFGSSTFLSLALLCCAVTSAGASSTYNYTGTNYTFSSPHYDASDSVTISLTFESALAPDLIPFNATSSVIDYRVSDGVNAFGPSDDPPIALILLSTDGSGQIVEWLVSLGTIGRPGSDGFNITSGSAGAYLFAPGSVCTLAGIAIGIASILPNLEVFRRWPPVLGHGPRHPFQNRTRRCL